MRIFIKKCVGWLLWSTFYTSSNSFELPNNTCATFWRTLLAVILLPLSWLGHIINAIGVKAFDKHNDKVEYGMSLYLQVLLLGLALVGHSLLDSRWDLVLVSDPIWQIGLIGVLYALIGGVIVAVILGVIAGLFYIGSLVYQSILGDKINSDSTIGRAQETIDGIRNKHYSAVDWSDVTNK